MRALVDAVRRHPAIAAFAWIAVCWGGALIAGDLLVAAGYSL